MREIKFRAWDENLKIMFVVSNIDFRYPKPLVLNNDEPNYANKITGQFPLMQYTGLKDKNGKEIYESDRVKYRVGGAASSEHEGVIEWFDYYWGVKKEFGLGLLQDVEVIGNVYEN